MDDDIARIVVAIWFLGFIVTLIAAFVIEKRTKDDDLFGAMTVLSVVWPALIVYLLIRNNKRD